MKIIEKLKMNRDGLMEYGPITIVAFGDSVTHGALNPGEMDFETVYWNRLKQKIHAIGSFVPVNVINAGIGGITAAKSLPRLESQVLVHHPDLVIVCFGLNDVNREKEIYLNSLSEIFQKCKAQGADVIFMTPNMMNTYVAEDTAPNLLETAQRTAMLQSSGRMDEYMAAACQLAEEMGVTVCDCYAEWKRLSLTQDITRLLVNRINHPTREMHELFAQMLFDTIFQKASSVECSTDDAMYSERENGASPRIEVLEYRNFYR